MMVIVRHKLYLWLLNQWSLFIFDFLLCVANIVLRQVHTHGSGSIRLDILRIRVKWFQKISEVLFVLLIFQLKLLQRHVLFTWWSWWSCCSLDTGWLHMRRTIGMLGSWVVALRWLPFIRSRIETKSSLVLGCLTCRWLHCSRLWGRRRGCVSWTLVGWWSGSLLWCWWFVSRLSSFNLSWRWSPKWLYRLITIVVRLVFVTVMLAIVVRLLLELLRSLITLPRFALRLPGLLLFLETFNVLLVLLFTWCHSTALFINANWCLSLVGIVFIFFISIKLNCTRWHIFDGLRSSLNWLLRSPIIEHEFFANLLHLLLILCGCKVLLFKLFNVFWDRSMLTIFNWFWNLLLNWNTLWTIKFLISEAGSSWIISQIPFYRSGMLLDYLS